MCTCASIENVHVLVNRECARARHSGLMCQAERSEWISSISEALHVAKERAANDLLGKSAIEHWRCRLGLVVNSQHFQVLVGLFYQVLVGLFYQVLVGLFYRCRLGLVVNSQHFQVKTQ